MFGRSLDVPEDAMSNEAKVGSGPGDTRRLIVVLSNLGLGGAQKVASSMVRYWVGRGHAVTVVTVFDDPPDFYRLPPIVERLRLVEPRGLQWRVRRLLVRWFEGERSTAGRAPAQAGEDGGTGIVTAEEAKRLDGLRALYLLVLHLRDAAVEFIARNRILRRSTRRYALLVHCLYWRTRCLRRIFQRTEPHVGLEPARRGEHHDRCGVGRPAAPYRHFRTQRPGEAAIRCAVGRAAPGALSQRGRGLGQ